MPSAVSRTDLIKTYLQQQKELFGDTVYLGQSRGEEIGKTTYDDPSESTNNDVWLVSDVGTGNAWKNESWRAIDDLEEFHNAISGCMQCSLGETRNRFVFGSGNPHADLMFIGEAPGADEDKKGIPFVGRAGQLLDKILSAIDLERSDVYIANILKCRPPQNRDPQSGEIACCEPYLLHQIKLINPVLMVALGRIAAQTLLRTTETLGAMRGKIHDYHGTDLMVTYHPAALLRNPNFKRPAWEDMKEIKRLYLDKRNNVE